MFLGKQQLSDVWARWPITAQRSPDALASQVQLVSSLLHPRSCVARSPRKDSPHVTESRENGAYILGQPCGVVWVPADELMLLRFWFTHSSNLVGLGTALGSVVSHAFMQIEQSLVQSKGSSC